MIMLLATMLAKRARSIAQPVQDRLLMFNHNPPAISFPWFLGIVLFCLLLGVGCWFEAGWRRDAWWRAEIARASAEVRTILREQGRSVIAGDEASIAELKREKDHAETELAALRAKRDTIPLSDACRACRIPADRLGLQQR
ncbi:MAG: hypothetical protein ACOYLQ_09375 [Hyphomicrobiaceae bacterium]